VSHKKESIAGIARLLATIDLANHYSLGDALLSISLHDTNESATVNMWQAVPLNKGELKRAASHFLTPD